MKYTFFDRSKRTITRIAAVKAIAWMGVAMALTTVAFRQFTPADAASVAAATMTGRATVTLPSTLPAAAPSPASSIAAAPHATAATQSISLWPSGWVDMHTHPMAHLGFGKKLIHGAPDIDMLVPKGSYSCNTTEIRAKYAYEALPGCDGTHGGWGTDNTCGDTLRAALINFGMDDGFVHKTTNAHGDHQHAGFPNFKYWPHQTSKTHQQMWWEWIKRAHEGGLKVMVALTVNNQLLANVLNGESPKMDVSSSNLQITEIKRLVNRHNDFMEIAYSSADLKRIVFSGKLAVILGMEVDDFGGFTGQGKAFSLFPEAFQQILVKSEIKRVYDQGVRYVFPIHLTNNVFGGTAVYQSFFNFANKHNNGSYLEIQHTPDASIKYDIRDMSVDTARFLRTQIDMVADLPAPCFNDISCLPGGRVRCCSPAASILQDAWGIDGNQPAYKDIAPGHINKQGLTPLGEYALQEMMKAGMMIDLDHMGAKSLNKALFVAEGFKGGYPVNLGHNGLRKNNPPEHPGIERNVNAETILRVLRLKGMFGLGTGDMTPKEFIAEYRKILEAVKNEPNLYASLAVGTDANGMELLPKNTPGLISDMFYWTNNLDKQRFKDSEGNIVRTWDYTKEGVAHYGLMKEFMVDVKTQPNGLEVWNHLKGSPQSFFTMWEACEKLANK